MIEINNITKKFGDFTAIENMSFKVDNGSIYGLVGYNGAGKTTLLKTIADVYRATDGNVTIDGKKIKDNNKIKERIFYVPDDIFFVANSTMNKMAKFYSGFYSKFNYDTYNKLVELFGLNPDKRLNGFSKGMQRQAEMVLALSTRPDILLLDESFDGLDPAKRNLTKKLLLDYMAEKDCSVIISSHNLHELADMCDHIALIDGQKIAIDCAVDDMNGSRCKFRLAYTQNVDKNIFNGIEYKNYKADGKLVSFTVSKNIEEAERIIAQSNPVLIERFPLSLEEIFLEEMEDTNYDFEKLFS